MQQTIVKNKYPKNLRMVTILVKRVYHSQAWINDEEAKQLCRESTSQLFGCKVEDVTVLG